MWRKESSGSAEEVSRNSAPSASPGSAVPNEHSDSSGTTWGGPYPEGPARATVGVPIDIPGLSTLIPELSEGRLLVVESGADPAKSFFVRRLGLSAMRQGWPLTFVTSRDRDELERRLAQEGAVGQPATPAWAENLEILERDILGGVEDFTARTGLLVVDSFSLLTLQLPSLQLAQLLREIRTLGRRPNTAIILATDRGVSEPRSEAITMHLADGVVQFHAKDGPEGLVRFLRIPKWMDARFVDQNIYYDYDGRRMAIDLRRRVL
jgi:KaiC/GvpD/RAD55 family RecA-like ATPase